MHKYKYIAIEGNIGAGKSTLANFLHRHIPSNLLLEEFEENDSLKDFYNNPKFALQAEMQFLLDRNRQLNQFHSSTEGLIIADYIPKKSLIFAKLNLTPDDYQLYEQMANKMLNDFPQPDLVIYLKRTTDELLQNIRQRGRDYETDIQPAYLNSLNESYENDLDKLVDCPIIEIKAKDIVLNNVQGLKAAFERIFQSDFASTRRNVDLAQLQSV